MTSPEVSTSNLHNIGEVVFRMKYISSVSDTESLRILAMVQKQENKLECVVLQKFSSASLSTSPLGRRAGTVVYSLMQRQENPFRKWVRNFRTLHGSGNEYFVAVNIEMLNGVQRNNAL